MATLRKGDLAARVAEKLGGPRSWGDGALNAVLDSVREALDELAAPYSTVALTSDPALLSVSVTSHSPGRVTHGYRGIRRQDT